MKVEILKPIGGFGDVVEGLHHHFALERGMIANVEDEVADRWIASGIAKAAPEEKPAARQAPEIEMLATPPEKTVLPRPGPKGRPRKNTR